jgi:hypothetical protein
MTTPRKTTAAKSPTTKPAARPATPAKPSAEKTPARSAPKRPAAPVVAKPEAKAAKAKAEKPEWFARSATANERDRAAWVRKVTGLTIEQLPDDLYAICAKAQQHYQIAMRGA